MLAWRVLSKQFDWLPENGKFQNTLEVFMKERKKQILKSDEMEILTSVWWRAKDPNVHAMIT